MTVWKIWPHTRGELKGKAAEAFQERVNDVLRNRQVNALVLDLDLPISLDDLERRPWNREATHQLFDGLEFRVLRDRLLEALAE
jgi:DNA polymerase-1